LPNQQEQQRLVRLIRLSVGTAFQVALAALKITRVILTSATIWP